MKFVLSAAQLRPMIAIKLALIGAARLYRIYKAAAHFAAHDPATFTSDAFQRHLSNSWPLTRVLDEIGAGLCELILRHRPRPSDVALPPLVMSVTGASRCRMRDLFGDRGRKRIAVLNSPAGAAIRTSSDESNLHVPFRVESTPCVVCHKGASVACACCGVPLCISRTAEGDDACWLVLHQSPAVDLTTLPAYRAKLLKQKSANDARRSAGGAASAGPAGTPATPTPPTTPVTPSTDASLASDTFRTPATPMATPMAVIPRPAPSSAAASNMAPAPAPLAATFSPVRRASEDASAFSPPRNARRLNNSG